MTREQMKQDEKRIGRFGFYIVKVPQNGYAARYGILRDSQPWNIVSGSCLFPPTYATRQEALDDMRKNCPCLFS